MNANKLIVVLTLSLFSNNILAYGSSSSKKACSKPKFTQYAPVHLAVVSPQAEFSFFASALTNPETLVVSVKKQPIDVVIDKTNAGYRISGILPDALQNTYARVDIKATGTNDCKANDGWLLKIEEVK